MLTSVEPLIRNRIKVTEQGCWEWQGYVGVGGYGRICRRGKNYSVHRYVYKQVVGSIAEGLDLDHLCRVRACCNPEHLEPVTRGENIRRGVLGETTRAYWKDRPHCKRGHPLFGENVYLYVIPSGYTARKCRTCMRDRKRARRAAGLKD